MDGPLVIAILTSCGGSLIGAFCGSSYVAYSITRFVTAVGKLKVPIFWEGQKKTLLNLSDFLSLVVAMIQTL